MEDPGARFENLVASFLLKYCNFQEDIEGHQMGLHYLRDKEKREVDFVVTKEGKPLFGVECKLKSTHIGTPLKYYAERLKVPKWYQVTNDKNINHGTKIENIFVISFENFCLILMSEEPK